MADHVDFIDGDVSQGNRVPAAWLNDVNDATYRANSGISGAGANRTALARANDWISLKDLGAVADGTGVTGVGTNNSTAINAAIVLAGAGPFTLYGPPGIYRIGSQINVVSNLKLIMAPNCVLFKDFDTTGFNGGIGQATNTVKVTNVLIQGGEVRGRTDYSDTGNSICLYGDDVIIDSTLVNYYGNLGRGIHVVGDRIKIFKARGTNPDTTHGADGGGGIRFLGGDAFLAEGCDFDSYDDCYQFAMGASTATNGQVAINRGKYIGCVGRSRNSRLMCATVPADCTSSITDVQFIGVTGRAPKFGGVVTIDVTSTGTINGVIFLACVSTAVDGPTTSIGSLTIDASGGTIKNVSLDGRSSIRASSGRVLEIKGDAAPQNIFISGGTLLEAPSTALTDTTLVRTGKNIYISDSTIETRSDLDGLQIGLAGGVDVENVHLRNLRVTGVGDGFSGILFGRCIIGSAKDCLIEPTSGTTTAKGIGVSATSDNITLDSCDVDAMTSTTPIVVSASSSNVIVKNCLGFVTKNSGISAIASGTTSIAVAHGLAVTPTLDSFSFVFGENPSNDITKNPWISTIGGTNFTLNVAADPGASNLDFGWIANKEKVT